MKLFYVVNSHHVKYVSMVQDLMNADGKAHMHLIYYDAGAMKIELLMV